MTRLRDRKLKKRAKEPKQKIKYKTLLASGVKDTKENKKRWLNGEALDLLVEAIEAEEELNMRIKHDPVTNKIDVKFLEEQENSENIFFEHYKEQE